MFALLLEQLCRRVLFLLLVSTLITTGCLAEGPAETVEPKQNPYLDAQFSFSSDPTKAVLTITTSSNDFTERSLILYGDGRMEIKDSRYGTWIRSVDIHEMESVLRMAVIHGLAEWDADTIRAQQLRDYGAPFPGITDGMRVRVLLVLENYERGTYEINSVNRVISAVSPRRVATYFPKIPQFEGTAKMVSWLVEQINSARESDR